MWGVSLKRFHLMHFSMAHSMVCWVFWCLLFLKSRKLTRFTAQRVLESPAGVSGWMLLELASAAVAQSVQVQPEEHLEWLFQTYRDTLEDVELWAVKFLDFIIRWNRDWYETEVLGEQDDQQRGPVQEKNGIILATAIITHFKEMDRCIRAG